MLAITNQGLVDPCEFERSGAVRPGNSQCRLLASALHKVGTKLPTLRAERRIDEMRKQAFARWVVPCA